MEKLCDKCGTKQILMNGSIYGTPDSEPYESGVYEDVEIDECEISIHFNYCPTCKNIDYNSLSEH